MVNEAYNNLQCPEKREDTLYKLFEKKSDIRTEIEEIIEYSNF